MRRQLVLLAVVAALLAACAPAPPTTRALQPRPCDDGGSGGVLIDGVCL
jgi:type IV pilus biogenesis protein CpaD/CtpE